MSLQVMVVGMHTHGPVDAKRREACFSHESPDRTWIYCLQVF